MKENLYHFTSTAYLPDILINGLRFHKIDVKDFEYQYSISTTRFFDFKWFNRRMRITLDKNEIMKNFKILPIHYKNWQGIKSKYNIIDNRINGHDDMMNQFEERIVLNPTNVKYYKNNNFYLPAKYIKQIDIINPIGVPPKTIEEMSKLDNPHNIKINIVDKYKPIKEMKHIKTYQQIFEETETFIVKKEKTNYEHGFIYNLFIKNKKIGQVVIEDDIIIDVNIDPIYQGNGYYKDFLFNYVRKNPIGVVSIFRSKEANRVWDNIIKNLPDDLELNKKMEEGELVYHLKRK